MHVVWFGCHGTASTSPLVFWSLEAPWIVRVGRRLGAIQLRDEATTAAVPHHPTNGSNQTCDGDTDATGGLPFAVSISTTRWARKSMIRVGRGNFTIILPVDLTQERKANAGDWVGSMRKQDKRRSPRSIQPSLSRGFLETEANAPLASCSLRIIISFLVSTALAQGYRSLITVYLVLDSQFCT